MSLTSPVFFYTLIAATVLAVVLTMAGWGALRGPKALRWLVRLVMIGVCQLTAIAVVAVWINNSNGLYTSWDDLLGSQDGGGYSVPDTGGAGIQTASFGSGPDGSVRTVFHGPASGLTGEVLVWKPPQYDQPQYRSYRFPVIVLLHGYPGSPESWLNGGQTKSSLTRMMLDGQLKPSLVVVPRIDPAPNTDCTDVHGLHNGTWLDTDVPNLVKQRFRTLSDPHGWALVGYSTGGYCAAKLALQHPDRFGAAVALSPDDFRGDRHNVPDARVLAAQNPLALARNAGPDADVSILIATSLHDRYSTRANAMALRAAARFPVQVPPPVLLKDGGHNWRTWASLFPVVFPWLSQQLDAPQPGPAGAPSQAPGAGALGG